MVRLEVASCSFDQNEMESAESAVVVAAEQLTVNDARPPDVIAATASPAIG